MLTTIKRLERLEANILHEEYSRVALSSIVYQRTQSSHVRAKIKQLNNMLLAMCSRNAWTYIDNDNVDESCLQHGDNVHPNRYGTERLAHNLAAGIRQMVLRPHLVCH